MSAMWVLSVVEYGVLLIASGPWLWPIKTAIELSGSESTRSVGTHFSVSVLTVCTAV